MKSISSIFLRTVISAGLRHSCWKSNFGLDDSKVLSSESRTFPLVSLCAGDDDACISFEGVYIICCLTFTITHNIQNYWYKRRWCVGKRWDIFIKRLAEDRKETRLSESALRHCFGIFISLQPVKFVLITGKRQQLYRNRYSAELNWTVIDGVLFNSIWTVL